MMAGLNNQNNESTANQLLNFVSNASKELKDMLGKVDNDEKANTNFLTPGFHTHLPSTPMASPVPSPTPSCVSSVSDQEVPSMSPRFFASNTPKRVRRKRSFDSAGEAPPYEFSEKYRRADSVGDYDEYYPSCAMVMRQHCGEFQASSLEMEQRKLQYQGHRKSHNFNSMRPAQQQFNNGQMQKVQQMQQFNSSALLSNQQAYVMQQFEHQQNFPHVNPVDPTPDFADLVSWMLAEDFLDAETLSALLLRC